MRNLYSAIWSLLVISTLSTGVFGQTFSNTATLSIPDNNSAGTSSNITVSNAPTSCYSVSVTIPNISHTYYDDLDIMLISPTGQRIILMSDCGGDNSGTGNRNYSFVQGGTILNNGSQPTASGQVSPTDYETGESYPAAWGNSILLTGMNQFTGNPNGLWTLRVRDDFSQDVGSLIGGWSITVSLNALPTSCASLSAPSNGATNVALTQTITWAAVNGATGYDVYFGTNQTLVNNQSVSVLVSSNQPGTSYSPVLAGGTTYYFKIVPRNCAGTVSGCSTWSFTTLTPYNPCTTIPTLTCGAAATSYSMAGSAGAWNSYGGTYPVPGQEKIFQFTPTITGVYNVTMSVSSGYNDLFVKAASSGCNTTGWTYVNDILGTETWGLNLTAGVTYYLMMDDEDVTANTGTISVACPAPPYNPCTSIGNITCGSTTASNNAGGSGAWDSFGGPYTTPGTEKIFTFTAPFTGSYNISVNNLTGYYVDLFVKDASLGCNNGGWTYLNDVAFGTEVSTVTLTGGVTYYIMLDDEDVTAGSATITITCPPPPIPSTDCVNTSLFGSATINPCGVITTISTCSYAGEYSLISGAVSGQVLRFTSSAAGDYITIRSGSSNGPVIAQGSSPLQFTNNFTGTLYAHWNLPLNCQTQNTCRTTTVQVMNGTGGNALDGTFTYSGNPLSISGNTTGACDNSALSASDDLIYAVTVGCAGSYTFSTVGGATWDTYLYLTTAQGGGGTVLAFNDDFDLSNGVLQSTMTAALTAGTYYVVVEGFSSTSSGAFTLNVSGTGSAPSITGSASNATCFGASNGSITATVNGNGNTATATLNGSSFNGSASGLAAGTYTLSASNCWGTSTQTFTVGQPAQLTASVSSNVPNSEVCAGGGMTLTGTIGGDATVTYRWEQYDDFFGWSPITTDANVAAPATVTLDLVDLSGSANYRLVVTSATDVNCTTAGEHYVTVTEDPTLNISSSNVSCNGLADGSVSVELNGGVEGNSYAYSWNNGSLVVSQGASANGLPAGTYNVSVIGSYGCNASASVEITQPETLVASSTSGAIACNGGSTTVTVTGNGGTAPYTGTGTFTVTAGDYSYTVTDANGCTATTSITVGQPSVLTASSTSGAIACNGGTTTVTVSGSGGTAPYTGTGNYTVSAGTYSYTVTDANGCTSTTSITVTEPTLLTANAAVSDAINCFGETGVITVFAGGGTTPYQGTGTFTVTAGDYSYTVTDANGCTSTVDISITEPAALTASSSTSDFNGFGVSCNGGNNGSITVSAAGGVTPYAATGSYNNLSAGTYSYTVTDANGCIASTSNTITEPAALTASSSTSDFNGFGVSCNGGNNGSITVSAAGGVTPYAATGSYNNLSAGTYSYTVTDANGCTATTSNTITEPTLLTANAAVSDAINCFGENGEITVFASGGTPAYTGTGPNVVSAGDYSYTVTDANGCTASVDISISEPTLLVASSSVTDAINCNGETGVITVTATGGTPGYTGTEDFTVNAGTYSYDVTDANGCLASTSTTITEPEVLTVNAGGDETVFYGYGPMECADLSASIDGGTPDYSAMWTSNVSGGGVGTDVTVCPQTNEVYTVTVTDANGCTASDDLSICVVNVECQAGNSDIIKVEMCQIPPGNPNNAHTICVDENAVPAHLAIGCTLGACGELDNCNYLSGMAVQGAAAQKLEAMNPTLALTAYPNPTLTATTVSVTPVDKGEYTIVLTDMTGRVIANIYTGFISDYENRTFEVDMTTLTGGVYVVNVIGGNGIMDNLKIVKE